MNQINVQPGQKVFEFTEQKYVITEATGPFPDVEEIRITKKTKEICIYDQKQPIFPNVKTLVIENHRMVDKIYLLWDRLFTTIDTISLQFAKTSKRSYLKCLGNYTANFEVTEKNSHYMAIDGILYTKDGTELLLCPRLKRGSICIPEGVQIVDGWAFEGCTLSAVTFPQNVQQIQAEAFRDCDNLSQVEFRDGIVDIGDWAFDECKKLDIVMLPSSIRTLGKHCFSDVQNIYIKSDRLPDGIVDSISAPWSNDFVTIITNIQTIIIPKALICSSMLDLNNIMQNPPISPKTIDTMFLYAYAEECKLKTAFAIYQRFQSPEAAQHLREHSLEALNLFIKEKQDKQIIDFIQFGLASLNDLQALLSDEYIQNTPTVKAYILQAIKYHAGHTNDIFKL